MRPFQWNPHYQTLIFWTGIAAWIPGIYLMWIGSVSAWWLLVAYAMHFAIAVVFGSVGMHRYFAHRQFKAGRVWHAAFAIFGTLAWTGSAIQWVALHTAHHRHSDGDLDPHYTRWDYLVWKRYRPVPLDVFRTRRLMNDKLVVFVHSYYVFVATGIIAMLALIHPMLAMSYFMAIGYGQLGNGLHQCITHGAPGSTRQPRDMWWMEWVVHLGGEWTHGTHHREAKRLKLGTRWWHLDTGALVARMIAKPQAASG